MWRKGFGKSGIFWTLEQPICGCSKEEAVERTENFIVHSMWGDPLAVPAIKYRETPARPAQLHKLLR